MVAPVGGELYSGAAGIALFLAYLAAVDPGSDVTDLALAAAALARRALAREGDLGGAFDGRAGMAYALLHVGAVLGRPDLAHEARRALGRAAEHARREETLDVIGGAAGAIAVLLAAASPGRSTRVLDAASAFGDRLVQTRVRRDRGCGWPNRIESSAPLTGAAHGAAGIAWALLRLADATGDRRFARAGREGLRYEQAAFDRALRNWPDFRARAAHREAGPMGWCYGAPGIGLYRLTLPAGAIGREEEDEIAVALDRVAALPIQDNDSLCHGELGNLDTLVSAAGRLQRSELLARARTKAALAAQRRLAAGRWRCGLEGTSEPVPGLGLGLAGIGYQLLRLAHPARVPSVLALEPPPSAASATA
jgi:type 2 lantibiotic biosynthesis protein LanM